GEGPGTNAKCRRALSRPGAAITGRRRPPPPARDVIGLLDLDSCTRVLKLLLQLRRLVLVDAFLDRLRGALDEILRLLQAEAGDRPHFLDHIDLLVADGGEDDVELGLLGHRRGSGCTAAAGGRDGDWSGGRNAPL